jgi:adenylate kinase family enzyme
MSTTRAGCRRPRSTPLSRSDGAKIAVVGTTGSGKTTVAKRLAEHYGSPHIELDALHWGPNWSEPTGEEFRARVEAALDENGWVVDGHYGGKLGDLVLRQADLVVWLDPSLATILRRLWERTVRRIREGDELWGGNRETWRGAFLSRNSLLVWALQTHFRRRRTMAAALAELHSVRLRSPVEADTWLERYVSAPS